MKIVRAIIGVAIAAVMAVLIVVVAVLALIFGGGGGDALGNDCGTSELTDDVPAELRPLYRDAAKTYALGPQGAPILAGINKIETDYGRNRKVSSAGAVGWMQFMPATWAQYGVDANHDGKKDPSDPADAIFAAARYLKAAGAPGDWRRAVFAYNHADWYVQQVLDAARALTAQVGDDVSTTTPVDTALDIDTGLCTINAGVPGKVVIAPNANRENMPVAQITIDFVAQVAGIANREITITTGTNHDQYTVDGNVSDHWDGHAADIGMVANGGTDDGPVGDRIMTACLIAGGVAPLQARQQAQQGGLFTLVHGGLRIQCIWKTNAGGNHHNHVHIGARPTGAGGLRL
jgi:hypothetical protein